MSINFTLLFVGVIVKETASVDGLTVGRQHPIVRGGGQDPGQEIGPLNQPRGSAAVAGKESQSENAAGNATGIGGNVKGIGIVIEIGTGKGL